jgi:hypothetical protein
MADMQSGRLRRIALVGVSLRIGAGSITILVPPANGYEISVYAAFPAYFWVFLIGAVLVGSLVIVGSARHPTDRSWVFGLALILLSNALLLLMPFVRGYQMYGRTDALTHIGFVRDIVSSGGISGNIYPPTHVLALTVAQATGMELTTIGMWIPVVFSGLYFGGMFYILVYLFDSRERILFGLPFVMLPVLGRAHVGFRPYDLSVMFIPLVIYLFLKSQRTPTPPVRAAFVVGLVALLLLHPLTALFVIGVFSFYLAGRYAPTVKKRATTPTGFFSLSVAVFAAWYSAFAGILNRLDDVYLALAGFGEGDAPVEGYTQTAEETSPALIDLVRTATFQYGVEMFLFGLGFTFLGLALLFLLWNEYTLDPYAVMFGGALVLFSIGGLGFLLVDLIVPHDRPWQIAKIGAVVFAGQLFYLLRYRVNWIRDRPGLRAGLSAGLTVAISVLIVLSMFSFYPSPLGSSSNVQVTEMETEGTQWLTQHGTAAEELSEFHMNYRRFYHAQHGTDTFAPFWGAPPPVHFNYTERSRLGESYESDRYMMINQRGRIYYPEVFPNYPENWRYDPQDFDRLERDDSVARVYDNGGHNQYFIRGGSPDLI